MIDNSVLHDNFRKQLTNVHAMTVITISIIEIIGYVILVSLGVEKFAVSSLYLWRGVIIPIAVNTVTHLVARRIISDPDVRRRKKNEVIIAAALTTAFVVAVFHKGYIVTGCAFVFPIILSSIFSERKLLETSFSVSLLILLCVTVLCVVDGTMSLYTCLSLVVLLGFAVVSFWCGIISINFSSDAYTTIERQAATNKRLSEQIVRDPMTGLLNVGAYNTKIKELTGGRKSDVTFSLVVIDIDYFKSINDRFGHANGDEVLMTFAKTLTQNFGGDDKTFAFRYGGEEFAIIFVQKNVDEVKPAVEKILEEFRNSEFCFTSDPITFSAGIASYTSGISGKALFNKADNALYKAKKDGRNRVYVA